MFLGAVRVRVGMGCGDPYIYSEKSYNICNFPGGGGVSGSPHPHLSMNS